MNRSVLLQRVLPLIAGLSVIAGCATVDEEAIRADITRTEAGIQQVEQSEQSRAAGGLELEQAKDKVARARRALENGDESTARRAAHEARLDADLAQAKAQSASAQRAVQELQASIEALRQEVDRRSQMQSNPTATTNTGDQ